MSISLHEFNQILDTQALKPVRETAYQALLARVQPGALENVTQAVQNGNKEAKDTLERYARSTGLLGVMLDLNLDNPTIDDARALYMNLDSQRLGQTALAAVQGNANARGIMTQWITEARNQNAGAGDVPETNQNQATSNQRTYMSPPNNQPTGQATVTPITQPGTAAPAIVHQPVQAVQAAAPAQATPAPQRQTDGHQRSQQPQLVQSDRPREFDDAKAYGGNAALTFAADETRGEVPTVRIEAATILNKANRTYDWQNKTSFQLTDYELQLVTALLFKHIPELFLSGHNEKWMSMTRQDEGDYAGTIKVTIGKGKATENKPRTVQIDPSSLGPIASLCLRRCTKMLKANDPAETFAILRQVAAAYMAVETRKKGGNNGYRKAG